MGLLRQRICDPLVNYFNPHTETQVIDDFVTLGLSLKLGMSNDETMWTSTDHFYRVLIMPQVFPVNAQTMNYAGPIMGFVIGVSWLWYKLYWVSLTRALCPVKLYFWYILQHRYYRRPGKVESEDKSDTSSTTSDSKMDDFEKKGDAVRADVLVTNELWLPVSPHPMVSSPIK